MIPTKKMLLTCAMERNVNMKTALQMCTNLLHVLGNFNQSSLDEEPKCEQIVKCKTRGDKILYCDIKGSNKDMYQNLLEATLITI